VDVLHGNVTQDKGMSIYKYRYQVDVYTHIYSQEGQHLFCEPWATPLNYMYLSHISARRGNTPLAQRGQHLALFPTKRQGSKEMDMLHLIEQHHCLSTFLSCDRTPVDFTFEQFFICQLPSFLLDNSVSVDKEFWIGSLNRQVHAMVSTTHKA